MLPFSLMCTGSASAFERNAAVGVRKVRTSLTSRWFPEFYLVSIRVYYPGEFPIL